jgi:hypothetical protein
MFVTVCHSSCGCLATHDAPERSNPAAQVKSHVPFWQSGVAFAGAPHFSHVAPQLSAVFAAWHCATVHSAPVVHTAPDCEHGVHSFAPHP